MKPGILVVILTILMCLATAGFPAQDELSGKPPALNSGNAPCTEMDITELTVPPDFLLVYKSGDSHGNRPGPRTYIEVHANGILKYFTGRWRGGSVQLPLEQLEISQENVKRIYAKVVGCGFFDLNEHYSNPRIMGGFSTYMSVTASGKSHGVSVSNTSVKRFDSVFKTLYKEAGIQTITTRSRGK
ncbi:MAG: hypothetical protein ABSF52_17905 [Syntrophobacteraceae bacterium]|jgi:hypothetical protein